MYDFRIINVLYYLSWKIKKNIKPGVPGTTANHIWFPCLVETDGKTKNVSSNQKDDFFGTEKYDLLKPNKPPFLLIIPVIRPGAEFLKVLDKFTSSFCPHN